MKRLNPNFTFERAANAVREEFPKAGPEDWDHAWSATANIAGNLPNKAAEDFISAYLSNAGFGLVYEDDTPAWDTLNRRIKIPRITRFASSDEYYAALLHEIVHSTGLALRHLDDPIVNLMIHAIEPLEAQEEMVAEIGSVMLADAVGLEPMTKRAGEYVANWLKNAPGEIKTRVFDICVVDAKKAVKHAIKVAGYEKGS